MIIANGKGRMSTLAVDDDLDMNGRNVTNADVVSVNEHVTLVGAQRLPGKGFRSTERNGWGVSKDNNDIERKFWKDDFSVDSSSQYTNLLECPFVINNGVMTLTGETYKQFLQIPYDFVEQSRNGSVKVQISLKPASGFSSSGQMMHGVGLYNSELDYVFAGIKVDEQGQTFISTFGSGIYSAYFTNGKFIKEYSSSDVYTVEVVIGSNSISITNLGIGNHVTLSVTIPLNIFLPFHFLTK